ncbi:MAG: type II toxin-antitoxin system RelE/ParE family toxin [Patescibacteria group bacterium]|nr:type II toxin-antitoxin system RelE/ParE family toxin [Patescibacteria group bacterium]MCL5432023.1 type II toxin-antitoxin system RelE/ParE family toxin [Patescibacteria group bacterium]
MFKLRIYPEAQREIKKIKRLYQISVIEALKELEDDPFSGKALTRELTGYFTYKIGQFRLIYKINAKDWVVEIISAGHRAIVYNN